MEQIKEDIGEKKICAKERPESADGKMTLYYWTNEMKKNKTERKLPEICFFKYEKIILREKSFKIFTCLL